MNDKECPLDISMISIADSLIDELDPRTVPIFRFDALKAKIPHKGMIDDLNAPEIVMLATHIVDKANTYQSVCGALSLEAKRRHQAAYAKAFRIDARASLEKEGTSVTDKTRKSYADGDERVMKYLGLMNTWGSLEIYFRNLREDMTNRFYFFKKVFEYQRKLPSE